MAVVALDLRNDPFKRESTANVMIAAFVAPRGLAYGNLLAFGAIEHLLLDGARQFLPGRLQTKAILLCHAVQYPPTPGIFVVVVGFMDKATTFDAALFVGQD